MNEDTSIGGVTWHSSDEDSGPNVGISVYLGADDRLWCGEISRTLWDEMRGFDHFDGDHGWFLVRYNPEPALIAKFAESHDAQEFMEQIAAWVRNLKS